MDAPLIQPEPDRRPIDERTKTCPRCAEEIKALAKVCHFCNAEFDVALRGYCSSCHEVTALTPELRCTRCGTGAIDVVVESSMRDAARPVLTPAPAGTPGGAPGSVGPIAAIPAGELREGFIGALRHTIGNSLMGGATAILVVVYVFGFSGSISLFRMGSNGIYYARAPLLFLLAPIVLAIATLRPLLPKFGPRGRRRLEYARTLRENYGLRVLFRRSGAVRNLVIALVTWGLILASAIWNTMRLNDLGYTLEGGAYLSYAAILLGVVGVALMWPSGADKIVRIDDQGNVYR